VRLQLHLSKTKKNEKKERVITYPSLSYNGVKTATRKHSFKSSAINGRAKGSKHKRNCGRVDGERRKKMIDDEHLKLLFMLRTILFYKIIKNKL